MAVQQHGLPELVAWGNNPPTQPFTPGIPNIEPFDAASTTRAAMSVAERFRAKGIECFERASRLKDPEYQRIYHDLAVEWLALAIEVDARVSAAVPLYLDSKAGKS